MKMYNNNNHIESCTECSTDQIDSDVEICNECFGLKRQRISENSEYCEYPLQFVKKVWLPLWLVEPEYMIQRTTKTQEDGRCTKNRVGSENISLEL